MSKRSMKVGTRLALGFGLVLVLMAGVSGLGIYNMPATQAPVVDTSSTRRHFSRPCTITA